MLGNDDPRIQNRFKIARDLDVATTAVASAMFERLDLGLEDKARTIPDRSEEVLGDVADVTKQFAFAGLDLLADASEQSTALSNLTLDAVAPWLDVSAMLRDVPSITDLAETKIGHLGFLGGLPSWEQMVAGRRRGRIRVWLGELGSDDDPARVELVEVDGSEFDPKWGPTGSRTSVRWWTAKANAIASAPSPSTA